MSEKNNSVSKSFQSTAGQSASEFSEISKRNSFSQREVGLNHPDNQGFIRLTDSGDIEIFAAPGVGIVINGSTKTISFFAENIKFYSKEDGLKWNSMEFNHSATTFAEPTFVLSDEKAYNPAFLNIDYYLDNISLIEQEDQQKNVTINGVYDYSSSTETILDRDQIGKSDSIILQLSDSEIKKLQEFWDKNALSYKSIYPEGLSQFKVQINNFLSEGNSLEQCFEKISELLGE